MKLLKQNDSAGGLIFKQNTAGKAMKQNFNFGKGLLNPSNHVLLDLSQYDTSDGLSFLFFSKSPSLITGGSHMLRIYTDMYYYSPRVNSSTIGTIRRYNLDNSLVNNFGSYNPSLVMFPPSPYVGLLYIYISSDYQTVKMYYNTTNIIHTITSASLINSNEILDKLAFVGISSISNMAVFERELNISELSYRLNNRSGNDLLSVYKLASLFNFNYASIIDNLFVGILDEIKNTGMNITSLPAGTLEEQRDYANDNLFESW